MGDILYAALFAALVWLALVFLGICRRYRGRR